MATFVLILFLRYGYAGGAVTVPNFPDEASCRAAARTAKLMHSESYMSSSCIRVPTQAGR